MVFPPVAPCPSILMVVPLPALPVSLGWFSGGTLGWSWRGPGMVHGDPPMILR